MGTSGHRRYGVYRIGSRDSATWPDGRAGWHVRRAGTRAHPLITLRAVWRRCLWNGLGLVLAGAVLHAPIRSLGAQVPVRPDTVRRPDTLRIPIPARADSILRDTLAKKDSLHPVDTVRADTIKAPLAHAERPADLGIGRTLHWTRDSLFATGALTLTDLLDRVPGITTYH